MDSATELIQKEVVSNSEMKDNSEVIQKETVDNEISKESNATLLPPTNDDSPCQQNENSSRQQQNQQPPVRGRSSREEKTRKKDDKSVDHVLKALNSLNTTEEKLAAMCKKYADIFDENRKVQLALKQAEKRCSTYQREKEQLQTEHSKAILTRSRLENLCRELQRQNKAIKDESLLKIREEEEKRKEVSAKFQTTLNEITTLMQQNNDKNMKLRDDNIDMNAKLKSVCEQYQLREQQVDKISKQMQLEAQLADAKLAKAKMEMSAERETMLREKQQLLMELSKYQARCQEFQATEISLRNQISTYDDKYEEFQKALTRSNEVFSGFKGEMEKMSKKMCKLEKEVSTWKQRWEGSHRALLEMAEEKQKADQELNHANRQVNTLQRLCRTLQGERSTLLAKLKGVSPSDGKIQDPIENTNEQLNTNVHTSPEQIFNGDVMESKNATKSDAFKKKTSNINEISIFGQNIVTEPTPSIEECVAKKSIDSKETSPDVSNKPNSEILLHNSNVSTLISNVDSSNFQKSEQNILQETSSSAANKLNACSITNNDTSLPENLIVNNLSKLPSPAISNAEFSTVTSDSTTNSLNSITSCSVTNPTELNLSSLGSPVSVENNNMAAISNALPDRSVTTVSNCGDSFTSDGDERSIEGHSSNNNDNSVDDNSSLEPIPVSKITDHLLNSSTASPETTNKQQAETISFKNKEIRPSDLNKKSNEQQPPVKKQNIEPKKGKESRKKKKNT